MDFCCRPTLGAQRRSAAGVTGIVTLAYVCR